jgi:hypothetical protein
MTRTVNLRVLIDLPLVCEESGQPCGASYSGSEKFVQCLGCKLDEDEKLQSWVEEYEQREAAEGWGASPTLYLDATLPVTDTDWELLAVEVKEKARLLLGDVFPSLLPEVTVAATAAGIAVRPLAGSVVELCG